MFKPGFKPIEKTKEYHEAGYFANPHGLSWVSFSESEFWVELAQHFIRNDPSVQFLSKEFIYLGSRMECVAMLGLSRLALRGSYSATSSEEQVTINAKSNVLVLVK